MTLRIHHVTPCPKLTMDEMVYMNEKYLNLSWISIRGINTLVSICKVSSCKPRPTIKLDDG
jgi:hypothetical protein